MMEEPKESVKGGGWLAPRGSRLGCGPRTSSSSSSNSSSSSSSSSSSRFGSDARSGSGASSNGQRGAGRAAEVDLERGQVAVLLNHLAEESRLGPPLLEIL
jgi:hypothetical protein